MFHTLFACFAIFALSAAADSPVLEKKLIEYGWDVPNPEYIRANIREMEQKPFDGLIFRLEASGNMLEPKAFDEAAYAKDYDNAANIAWEKFTDNFLILLAASAQDWFDDAQWEAILHNVKIVAKAARLARCVGICFDPEPYGDNPWDYARTAHHDTKPFPEYQAKVRERGAAFMRAIEEVFPHPQVLSFYQLALFKDLCRPGKEEHRMRRLATHDYALFPAFFLGMLEAASPETVFHDGNENAYYYYEAQRYFEAYHLITQRALHLVDPALHPKYRAQVRAAQALYIDQYYGLRPDKVLGNYMTTEEQPKWLEHNAYWALHTSDRYVWCYSEHMNWWTAKDIPAGAEDALRSAENKISSAEPLGFDLQPIVEAAERAQQQAQKIP